MTPPSSPQQPFDLSVDHVTVTYRNGHVAVRDASFRLRSGTICALVGVNGSGKSTLFKTIMGFLRPDSGAVSIGGESIRQAQSRNWVSYVPQSEEVDWTFPVTVWDVVMMGRYGHMNLLRIPSGLDRRKVEESLRRVDLWELRDRQIGELSGGQKKRAFLARSLAQEGRVILLDEPFTGVDVRTEAAIIQLLKELRDTGQIILVSTHNLGSVPEFCDHAVIIQRSIIAAGPLAETFTEQNLATAFGGVLRHFRFDQSTVQPHDNDRITVLTDDERPLVFGKDGHLEFTERREHEDIVRERTLPGDET
jgi:manganese/iron transport system ATP-binding protein